MFEWTVLRISEKGDWKEWKKWDEVGGYITDYTYQRLSQQNHDQFRFNQLWHLLRNHFLTMGHYNIKKNFSRFYTTFLKSVKCRTILVLTFFSQKGRKKIRPSDSENVKWKMINPWNPFNAVRSIAADRKARRFEGHLTHRKIARRKLRVKAFVAVLWVVMYEGLVLLTKILLFPAA